MAEIKHTILYYVCICSTVLCTMYIRVRVYRIVEGSAPLCVVCGISVPLSSRRRTLFPPVVANEEARGFFLKFVADASSSQVFQDVSRPAYACKPCFAKLETGNRHDSAILFHLSANLTRK